MVEFWKSLFIRAHGSDKAICCRISKGLDGVKALHCMVGGLS
jgi:hypothetical protein